MKNYYHRSVSAGTFCIRGSIAAALAFFVLFAACGDKTTEAAAPPGAEPDLLSLYETMDAHDTVYVFSADDPGHNDFRYKGKPIDTALVRLLPGRIKDGTADGYFACGKFELDSSFTALITRAPGKYVPSALWLLVYDKSARVVKESLKLADFFGEGGSIVVRTAKLFKQKNEWLAAIKQSDAEDRSIENPSDTTMEVKMSDCLIKIHPLPLDTIETTPGTGFFLGPKITTIGGTLKTEWFWGPPGYGEDTTVDRKELVYTLLTDKEMDISDAETKDPVAHAISQIQVVSATALGEFKDKHVSITGTLSRAESGHHHLPVFINAASVKLK